MTRARGGKICTLLTVLVVAIASIGQQQTGSPAAPTSPQVSSPVHSPSSAAGQSTEKPLPACTKTITFAAAEGGQPVPAIPKFAAKWIGKAKHVEGYPDMCLSQMPSARTANYVVIFSITDQGFDGFTPVAHTYTSSGPPLSEGMGISSYGGTWSYSYAGVSPPATTATLDLQRIDGSKKALILRAYGQQGRLVAHYSVDPDHNRENRLEQVFADIHRDVVDKRSQKRLAAPLSVYYVNCDVDSPGPSSLVAATEAPGLSPVPKLTSAATTPAPPPSPPQSTVDLWSDPAGADIYLDGTYIGKTPFTATVAPGEHVVILRKADFSTWGRKLQLVPGPRKIAAHLERKFLTLAPATIPQPGSN